MCDVFINSKLFPSWGALRPPTIQTGFRASRLAAGFN